MIRSFSYTLLITWILFAISCKTTFVSTNVTTQNISVDDNINPIDSQLIQLYLPYKKILQKDMERVISFSEKEMGKSKPESELTNLLSDILLEEAQNEASKGNLNIKPVVSFFNYNGIRTSLPRGEITVGKIFELMPFENEMVFIQLTGAQLQYFYDIVAENGGDSVGGVRFVISNGKAINVFVDGVKLEPARKYWLVTSDYSANGGDGLEVFTKRSEIINSGKKIRDVIISNLEERQKNNEKLVGKLDGRITNE
jgi:2',3'-cyclic-nucleotide 2'-phosphodiesterase (5'-nucleotidase family)